MDVKLHPKNKSCVCKQQTSSKQKKKKKNVCERWPLLMWLHLSLAPHKSRCKFGFLAGVILELRQIEVMSASYSLHSQTQPTVAHSPPWLFTCPMLCAEWTSLPHDPPPPRDVLAWPQTQTLLGFSLLAGTRLLTFKMDQCQTGTWSTKETLEIEKKSKEKKYKAKDKASETAENVKLKTVTQTSFIWFIKLVITHSLGETKIATLPLCRSAMSAWNRTYLYANIGIVRESANLMTMIHHFLPVLICNTQCFLKSVLIIVCKVYKECKPTIKHCIVCPCLHESTAGSTLDCQWAWISFSTLWLIGINIH